MGAWSERLAALRTPEITDKTDKTPSEGGSEGVLSVLSVKSWVDETEFDDGGGDPFERWRIGNAETFTAGDAAQRYDVGGFCAVHHRRLSYPEQKRGACSWCVPVDPEREPEYWASHWRRFRERS
jgi:hypothetical protein